MSNFLFNSTEKVTDAFSKLADEFWSVLEHPDFPFVTLTSTTNGARNFPPYDIIEEPDGKVRLNMAVAGYTKDSVKVEKEGNTLIITGMPLATPPGIYRHNKLFSAKFVRTFDLQPNTKIADASMRDGILSVLIETIKTTDPRVSYPVK